MKAHAVSALAVVVTATATATRSPIKAYLDPSPKQTITSFGASGAWWPNDLIHFPEHVQSNLSDFLFSEEGIHLSSYRYNVGGDGGHDEQQVTANGSRVESFLLRNGTYDWNRDHAGVKFLKAAQRYAVPYITFFLNAAPSHIADNGASCGWNLTAAKTPAFANYIATVLSHWTKQGLDIAFVSPMNEPDNLRADCGQEGMAVAPSLRSTVFATLRSALNSSPANRVSIIGDETSQITTQALPEDPIWLPPTLRNHSLSTLAVHNYDYPSDANLTLYRHSLETLTNHSVPPLKFTETCCSTTAGTGPSVFGAQYDPTMTNALIVARYIWQFLTLAQATSFDWWTAVTNLPCSPSIDGPHCATALNTTAGYNSGLVYIDGAYNSTRDYTLYPTKRAFMLKHFATFHRPGSVRLAVNLSNKPGSVEAFASKIARRGVSSWTVLFMNNATSPSDVTLAFPERGTRVRRIVRTTAERDWEVLPPGGRKGGGGGGGDAAGAEFSQRGSFVSA